MNTPKDVLPPSKARQQAADALLKFAQGDISAAELQEVTKALKASTKQKRAELREMQAAAKLGRALDALSASGRPPLPEGETMKPVSIYMKPGQREKLQRLGGAPWVRKKIDQAKE